MQKKILSMILAIAMVLSMFAGITITASAASTITTGKYVIAANIDGTYIAMPNDALSSKIVGAAITVTNGTVAEADAAAYAVNVTVLENGNITISNDAGLYLGYSSSTNFANVDNYEWIPTALEDGSVMFVASTATRCITYRTGTTNKFAPYATSNIGSNAEYNNVVLLPVIAEGACNHENAESTVTTPATCTAPGEATWTCSCGATGTTTVAPTGHNVAEWTQTVAPECTKKGEQTGTCATCGETVVDEIAALGHQNGEPVVTAPTCTDKGYTTVVCTVCTSEYKYDEVAALGHTFENGACTVCAIAEPAAEYYALLTDASSLKEGDKIIIVGVKDEAKVAMSTEQKSNNRGVVDVTVNADGTITGINGVQVITLGGAEGAWTLGVGDGFLTATDTTGSNYLRTASEVDQYCYFSIEISADGIATVKAINKTSRNWMRYNSSSSLFACYSSGQSDICIYRLVAEGEVCAHANTTTEAAVAATCTTAGLTEKVICADCGVVLGGGEEIAATGHSYAEGVCSACGAAEPVGYDLATTLNAYDNVVIYYPTDKVALTATASGKKLAGTAAEVVDNKLILTADMAVMTVNYVAGSETDFYLVCNNMYLTSAATGNGLSFNAEADEYSIWYLEVADAEAGIVYIHSRNANYNGGAQSLEYYSGFTTYGTKTTSVYQFQLYTKAGEAPECEHAWGEGVETTAATCTEAGAELFTCTLCGATKEGVIAAKGHSYIYAETAVTCSACDYSAEYTLSDIATVRAYEADKVYYFKGIVTFIDSKNVYVQDATAAIVVYMTNTEAAAGLAIGDEILVWDTITSYNGLIETTYTTAQEYVKISSGNTPNTFTATPSALAADFATGEFQSEKVELDNVTVTEVGAWSEQYQNYSMTVSDGEGSVYVYRVPAATAEEVIKVGSVIKLKGIVAIYNGAYQLRIADASDIEVLSTCAHANTELQNVVANDCVNNGYTGDVVCLDCGVIITEGEVIAATGHSYVDGICEECGAEELVGAVYTKVTEIADGNYLLVYEDAEGNAYIFSGVDAANGYIAATIVDGTIAYTEEIAAVEVAIAAMEGGYSLKAKAGYMYGVSGSNALKFSDTAVAATIAMTAEGTADIVSNTGIFTFNNASGNLRFRFYKTTTVEKNPTTYVRPYLYALSNGTAEECVHANYELQSYVDSTCTEAGAITYVCLDCSATWQEEIAPTGHFPALVDNCDGATHTVQCCVCLEIQNASVPHSFVDAVCECGAENVKEDTTLAATMNISVGAEMQVIYTINVAAVSAYKSFYVEVLKDVVDGESVKTIFSLANGNVTEVVAPNGKVVGYSATYTGIFASEMGDNFTATLCAISADGNTIIRGKSETSSIKTFLYQKLADTATSAELKTLAVDMLNYGAAAQINFNYGVEELVNAELTDEQKALGTQGTPEAVSNNKVEGTGGIMQTSVSLQSKVILYVTAMYTSNADSNLEFVVKDALTGTVLDTFAPSLVMARGVQGSYSNVGAAQMRDLLTIELYDNGTLVSKTVIWSIEGYVAETREATASSEALVNIVNAMLVYGDSAAAYLAASGQ